MKKKIQFEYKFLIVYLLIGGIWILFSDRIVQSLILDINLLTAIQTYKGWFYVLITGLLFFIYLKKDLIKIRKAEGKAKKSESLKSAFLQNMSHEIRTPMNGIIGFVELLKDENLSKQQRERYMDIVLKCSDQLLGVVNDVLDLSMIETGNIKLEEERVHLNDLMDELYVSYSETISKNISLSLLKEELDKKEILTDSVKLKQVLDNLLSNAKKFTSDGKIEFGFEMQNHDLLFFVKDTGAGIHANLLKSIFNRFERADVETTKLIGGAGLGLAICKGIISEMGGKIWVESEYGTGSDFYFKIPYKPAQNNGVTIEKECEIAIQKDCLLIVEDEDSNFLYLTEVLEDLGFEISRAKNGKEAVSMYQDHSNINMILMDIKMPILDGFEATRRIRQFDSKVPIIAQTAFVLGNEKKQALEAGCTDYISKPFKKEEIYSIIKKHQLKV